MEDQSLFNWGFWDAFHSEQQPQQQNPAYLAGFKCGEKQRAQSSIDPEAQKRAFMAFLETVSEPAEFTSPKTE